MNDEIDYNLGVIWQDIQHRRIAKVVQEINSSSPVNYHSIFNQLRYYVEDHFDTEEQYMRKLAYDKMELHIKEHREFNKKFEEITESCFITGDALNTTVSSFLNEWILKHILEADNELAVFLLKQELNDT